MTAWIIQFVLYAALVGVVTWLSWRHAAGLVGVTLCMCLLVTEVAYFGTSFASRATLEAIQAVVIINSARVAFAADGSRIAIAIVAVAVADLAFIVMLGTGALGMAWRGHRYGVTTNVMFGLQCLFVAIPGVRDAIGSRRAGRGAGGLVGHQRVAGHARHSQGRRP